MSARLRFAASCRWRYPDATRIQRGESLRRTRPDLWPRGLRHQRRHGAAGPALASRRAQPAGSATAVSPAAELSGELTVWAMGNEGTKLGAARRRLHDGEPGVKVNVTPVDWDQAVAKLQTAIGGNKTPDVSQMGTDMMGQFAPTGALEAVPANFDPGAFFESAWNTGVVDGVGLRRALVRRDPAPLLPHRHRREGRHHRAAGDLGRAQGDRQGDEGEGRRRSTASPSARRTGRSTCRSCGRTAATSWTRAASSPSTARRSSRPSPSTSRSSRRA